MLIKLTHFCIISAFLFLFIRRIIIRNIILVFRATSDMVGKIEMSLFDIIAKIFSFLFGGKKEPAAETKVEAPAVEKKMAMKESVFAVMTSSESEEWKQKRLKDNLYVEDILLAIFKKHGMFEKYKRELIWRDQLLASDWILLPEWYGTYHKRRKMLGGNRYLSSNPFLHRKMKTAMWLLDHHISLPLRVLSMFNKSQND